MFLHKLLSLGLAFTICLVSAGNSNIYVPPAPVTGGLVPIATTDDMKYVPAVAYDSLHDQFLVVWEHVLSGTGVHEIDGALVSAAGALLKAFVVSSDTHNELTPDVAFDSVNSRYLVVWVYDAVGDQSDFDIYGRLIPSSGPDHSIQEMWIDPNGYSSVEPKVAFGLSPDAFLIVWKNKGYNTTPASISGALRKNDGSFVSFTVYSDLRLGVDAPAVAYDAASNNFLAAWQVKREFTGWDVEGQRLDTAGQALGNLINMMNSSYDDLHPSVAACPRLDMYLVEYEFAFSASSLGLGDKALYGDGSDVSGGAWAALKPIFWPKAACAPGGDLFQIAWAQAPDNSTQLHIRVGAEVMKPNSAASGYSTRVDAADGSGDRVYPAIASGKLSSLVVWEQVRDPGGYTDIYGRIIYAYGAFLPVVRQ